MSSSSIDTTFRSVHFWRISTVRYFTVRGRAKLERSFATFCCYYAVRPYSKRRLPSRQLSLRLPVTDQAEGVQSNVEHIRVGGGSEWTGRTGAGARIRGKAAVGCHRAAGRLPELRAGMLRRAVRRPPRLHGRVRPAATSHSTGHPEPLHHGHNHPHHRHRTTAKDKGETLANVAFFCVKLCQ